MLKSECGDEECTATPGAERKEKKRAVGNRSREANAHVSVGLVFCHGPDGQSDDSDENDEGQAGNETASRPLFFSVAHLSNKLGALSSSFGRFPVGRCTKGNTENKRSYDPENREHC